MKYLRLLPLIAFFIGLLIECVLGTGAAMLFQWPGLAALGIAGVLSAILIKEKLKFAPSDICVLLALIAAGYFVGRATTSPVVYHAREDIVLVLGCLAVYLFSAFALAHPRRRVFLFWALVALALGNLVVGVQHLRGDPAFHILPNYSRTYAEGRIGGFFNNPNHFAAFLIFPSLACLAMALFGRGGPAKKLLIGFVGIAAAIGVALSASRGGIIGLGMGGVVLCIASIILLRVFFPYHFKVILIAATAVLLVGGGALYYVNQSLLQERFDKGQIFSTSLGFRPTAWAMGIEQWQMNPATGMGSRSYQYYSRQLRPAGMHVSVPDPEFAHNEYVQTLADYGAIGLALIGLAVGAHLFNGLRFLRWYAKEKFPASNRAASTQLALCLAALTGLIAMAGQAVFEFQLHIPAVAFVAAAMLGVLANPGFESFGTERRRIPLVRPLARIALIGIGAWLCWGASHFGKAERIMEQAQFTGIDEDMGLKKIDLLRQAKEIDPDNFYLYYTSGQTWMAALNGGMPDIVAKSFVEKALADFDYARTLYPYDYINYQNIALCLTWLRRYDEAETMLKEAIRWAPNHNPPWMDYARFLTQQGRLKEAEEAYEKARRGAYHERIVDTEIALLRQRMKAEGIPTMLDAPKPE